MDFRRVLIIIPLLFLVGCATSNQAAIEAAREVWGTAEQIDAALREVCKDGPAQYGLYSGIYAPLVSLEIDKQATEIGEVCSDLGYATKEQVEVDYRKGQALGKYSYIYFLIHKGVIMQWISTIQGIAATGAVGIP